MGRSGCRVHDYASFENVTKASFTGVGLLSDHEDTDVLRGYEKYPDLFLPFLANCDPNDPQSTQYVRHQLNNGPWRGVGELFLDTTDTVYASIPLRDGTVRKHPYPVPKDFPDRICLGTDTYSWRALAADFYKRVHEIFHELTAHLSSEQTQRIAKGNFQRLVTTQFRQGSQE
jgi:hypothetical protein